MISHGITEDFKTKKKKTQQKPSALRELLHLPTGNSGIKNQVLSQLKVLRPHGLLHEGERLSVDPWRRKLRLPTGDVSHRRFIGPGSAQGDSDS